MSRSSRTSPDARSGSRWSLSLGLLLLCGFMSWASAAPGVASQSAVPLVIDQIEQLVLAGSDNLRSRPTLRKDDAAPEDDDTLGAENPTHTYAATALPIDALSSQSIAYIFSSSDLPTSARYALPASREPPKA